MFILSLKILKSNISNDLKKSSNSEHLDFSFKNYQVKIINHPDPLLIKAKQLRQRSFFEDSKEKLDSDACGEKELDSVRPEKLHLLVT